MVSLDRSDFAFIYYFIFIKKILLTYFCPSVLELCVALRRRIFDRAICPSVVVIHLRNS
jgi:hypothetical protein